jgi:hypothetical protein
MTRLALALIALLSVTTLAAHADAQRLGHVSGSVHGGGGFRTGGSFGRSFGGFRSGYGYQRYGYGYGGYGAVVGAAPGVSDPLAERVQLPYPYALGYVGVRVERRAESPERPIPSPGFLGVLDVNAGWVPDGIVRGSIAARLSVPGTIDVELRYGAYLEQTTSSIAAIGIGRLGLAFYLADTDVVQLRGSVGGLVYHDAAGLAVGADGLLELDLYPGEPITVSVEAGGGVLGGGLLLEGRASFGVQIDRGELYVGYQVLGIFPQNGTAGDVLHGPILGLRVWIS